MKSKSSNTNQTGTESDYSTEEFSYSRSESKYLFYRNLMKLASEIIDFLNICKSNF